jgi:hypothetical protein
MKLLLRLAVILLASTSSAWAEMLVEINSTSNDTVGQRLVYYLKEGIRSSSSLGISFDQKQARLQVNVVTLDQDTRIPGYSTVYSVVILWNNPEKPFPFYLNQLVGYCGSGRVRECADGLVANVSEQADNIIRLLKTVSQ